MADYYKSEDLAKFGDIGKISPELAEKFFSYYNAVTGTDGALSKREKALIGLAVAISKKCPYCIDAYSTQCIQTGADPEQMTEAIHVSAAMSAGVDLVHGVQMHNHLREKGLL